MVSESFRRFVVHASLVAAAGLASGCGGCGKNKEDAEAARADAAAELARAEAAKLATKMAQDRRDAEPLGVVEFIQEFTESPGVAREKYEGQMFKVSGEVQRLEGDKITILDRNGAAQCTVPSEQARALSVGESIAVTGLVTVGSGHVAVRLNACEVMEHGPAKPKDASPE